MFEKLRRKMERALDALDDRFGPETEAEVDRLLAAMREELIEARARLKAMEERERKLDRARARAVSAENREASSELSARLAEHRSELAAQREAVREMTARLKAAMRDRTVLAAKDRRSGRARESLEEGQDALRAFERSAEAIEDRERMDDARREVEGALEGSEERDAAAEEEMRELLEADLDRKLRELKEEMDGDAD
jgi:uncharacterized coiled-coil protein SlyX